MDKSQFQGKTLKMLRITKIGNCKLTLMHLRKIVNLQGKIIKQSIKTRVLTWKIENLASSLENAENFF